MKSSEQSAEVRLVRQSAIDPYLPQRHFGFQQQLSRMVDTTPQYVVMRGVCEAVFERATEMRFAQANKGRELPVSQRLFQVLFDVLPDQSRLPGRQTAARAPIGSRPVGGFWHHESVQLRIISKQLRRSFDAFAETGTFIPRRIVDRTEELTKDPPQSLEHRRLCHLAVICSDAIIGVEMTTLAHQTT